MKHSNNTNDDDPEDRVPRTMVAAEEASILGAFIEPFVSRCVNGLSQRGGMVFREAARRVVDAAFAEEPFACFAAWGDTPDPLMPAVLSFWSVYTSAPTMERMGPVKTAIDARLATMPRCAIDRKTAGGLLASIRADWEAGEMPQPIAAAMRRAFDLLITAFASDDPLAVLRGYGQDNAEETIFRALANFVEANRTDELDVIMLAIRSRVAELDLSGRQPQ